jgi:hypothetical protein
LTGVQVYGYSVCVQYQVAVRLPSGHYFRILLKNGYINSLLVKE